ncbi:MAG: alpha-ketoglutarate-dependent dioxygenase AlkB, partial [Myxococcota bacterium]
MIEGFRFLAEYFHPSAQKALVAEVLGLLDENPLYRATMPRTGKPMSVRMTNLGPLGWISDITGYRYGPEHPVTGRAWAPIPQTLLDLWTAVSDYPAPPQACLVNWYEATSRLGLH